MNGLRTGVAGTAAAAVTGKNTAQAMKSGALPVFATPAMCALMEEAACEAVKDFLEEGEQTVGISLTVTHDRATPENETVTATAILSEIDGRRLKFSVEARDGKGTVGKGTHERFVINADRFMEKLK